MEQENCVSERDNDEDRAWIRDARARADRTAELLRPYQGGYRVAMSWHEDEVFFAAPDWDHAEWKRKYDAWRAIPGNEEKAVLSVPTRSNPDRYEREAGRTIVALKMVAEYLARRAISREERDFILAILDGRPEDMDEAYGFYGATAMHVRIRAKLRGMR